jgi:hypothetical protein
MGMTFFGVVSLSTGSFASESNTYRVSGIQHASNLFEFLLAINGHLFEQTAFVARRKIFGKFLLLAVGKTAEVDKFVVFHMIKCAK